MKNLIAAAVMAVSVNAGAWDVIYDQEDKGWIASHKSTTYNNSMIGVWFYTSNQCVPSLGMMTVISPDRPAPETGEIDSRIKFRVDKGVVNYVDVKHSISTYEHNNSIAYRESFIGMAHPAQLNEIMTGASMIMAPLDGSQTDRFSLYGSKQAITKARNNCLNMLGDGEWGNEPAAQPGYSGDEWST